MGILKELYGGDIFNYVLLAVFEFLSYFLAGWLGATTREIFQAKEEKKISRVLGYSLLTAIILFTITSFNLFGQEKNPRKLFSEGIILGFYIPNFMSAIYSGRIVKNIAKIFFKKFYDFLEEVDENSDDSSTKDDK